MNEVRKKRRREEAGDMKLKKRQHTPRFDQPCADWPEEHNAASLTSGDEADMDRYQGTE